MESDKPVFMATTPPVFGVDMKFERRRWDAETLASEMMRITRPDMPDASLPEQVRMFLADAGEVSMLPKFPDWDDLAICPVAHALSLRAGFDPVAMYALSRTGVSVGIAHPWWKVSIHVERRGHTLVLRAPVAPGAVWYGMRGPGGWLLLDPECAGIAEERAHAMYPVLRGTPVRATVSNPVLDPLNLTFTKVTAPHWTLFSAHTDGVQGPVLLRQVRKKAGGR